GLSPSPRNKAMICIRGFTALLLLLVFATLARSGHEAPIYPSFYPQEIDLATLAPERAGQLLSEKQIAGLCRRAEVCRPAPGHPTPGRVAWFFRITAYQSQVAAGEGRSLDMRIGRRRRGRHGRKGELDHSSVSGDAISRRLSTLRRSCCRRPGPRSSRCTAGRCPFQGKGEPRGDRLGP